MGPFKAEVLNNTRRSQFYKSISYAVIGGSILNLAFYGFDRVDFGSLIFMSTLLFVFGMIIRFIPCISNSHAVQDSIFLLILPLLMGFILIYYTRYYGDNIVWPLPFIVLIVTAVFRQKRFFYSVFGTALVYLIWSWHRQPEYSVELSLLEVSSHITIYIVFAFLSSYVNKLYIERMKEQEEHIILQGEIARISKEFISANQENINDRIEELLRTCGELFRIDHAYFLRLIEDHSAAVFSNEWIRDDLMPAIGNIGSEKTELSPWLLKKLEEHETIYIEDLEKLPEKLISELPLLRSKGVKSILCMPVMNRDSLLGFIGLNSLMSIKSWDPRHQEALQIMSNLLSDSIMKVESEKKINFMAYYDSLTGLPNRAYFNDQVKKMTAIAQRKEMLLGILFLDLDLFKSINDTRGHDAGDMLLKTVAERFCKAVRRSDLVCRFGGDEFLVMLPLMKSQDKIRTATEKIMEIFENTVSVKNQEFHITASCGVAVYPYDGETPEALIKNADLAMYESKNTGKNKYTFCTPIMRQEVTEKVELYNDLQTALERDELILHYQPQVCIETNRIIGLEALIRWNHPQRGIVLPGVFIPIAEQTGLIHRIGEWVLNTAVKKNKEWQDMGFEPMVMSVNLSVEQFKGSSLVAVIEETLNESGLDPKFLELEITESVATREPEYIIGVLHRLKETGVSISIDDFGTEYSSLSRLKELPIDRLKLAMEFVQGIDKGTKDEAIAVVIIDLAKSLGLRVIAEGVEEESQYRFMKKRVCDDVQGYYFYRPMPPEEIEQIFREEMYESASSELTTRNGL